MLELIVLGQIPGTPIQITLFWFEVIVLLLMLVLLRRFHKPVIIKSFEKPKRTYDIIRLRSLDQA